MPEEVVPEEVASEDRLPRAPGPRGWRPWAIGAMAGALLVGALLTWAVLQQGRFVLHVDAELTRWVRGWADAYGWPVRVARAVGILTAPAPSILYGLVVVTAAFLRGYRAAAGLIAISTVLGVTIAEIVKETVGRARPPGAEQYQSDLLRSFPSGHSMVGIYGYALVGVLAVLAGRVTVQRWLQAVGWCLVVAGPLIGCSRLVLGVHWPSDVLAGWAFGSAAALVAALAMWRQAERGWVDAADRAAARRGEGPGQLGGMAGESSPSTGRQ